MLPRVPWSQRSCCFLDQHPGLKPCLISTYVLDWFNKYLPVCSVVCIWVKSPPPQLWVHTHIRRSQSCHVPRKPSHIDEPKLKVPMVAIQLPRNEQTMLTMPEAAKHINRTDLAPFAAANHQLGPETHYRLRSQICTNISVCLHMCSCAYENCGCQHSRCGEHNGARTKRRELRT